MTKITHLPSGIRGRVERFGAWIQLPDGTLVAVDRQRAEKLGFAGGTLWRGTANYSVSSPSSPPATTRLVAPLELHIAITSKCPANCGGCYQDALPSGSAVSREQLERTLIAAANAGVFTVAFGGGEPLTHPELGSLAQFARSLALTPVVTTSGIGMTEEKARSLKAFAQVNVSHDGVGGGYQQVRGFDGAAIADRAIALLREQDIPVGVNLVLTRPSFGDGTPLEATCHHLAKLGAVEVQLLRYKPRGRAASIEYLSQRLLPSQITKLPSVIKNIVASQELSVRIDCALVPLLSEGLQEPRAAQQLLALGVMGCEAGNALGAVNREGKLAGCSFTNPSELGFEEVSTFTKDPATEHFRTFAEAAPEPCASCAIADVCRGGCKVVSEYLTHTFVPDPECPRVVAHSRGSDATST